jgi:hypothetical protein
VQQQLSSPCCCAGLTDLPHALRTHTGADAIVSCPARVFRHHQHEARYLDYFCKIEFYFKKVVQIFELKRIGGASKDNQFILILDLMSRPRLGSPIVIDNSSIFQ